MVEDESRGACGHVAADGSDVSRAAAVDLAAFEDCLAIAEDEIDVAGDIAVLIVLASAAGIQRVLHASEATMEEDRTIGVRRNGHRLRAGAVSVLEGQILGFEFFAANIHDSAEKCAADVLRAYAEADGGGRVIAPNRHTRSVGRDSHTFVVHALSSRHRRPKKKSLQFSVGSFSA
jgi:hypothetical protein